MEKQPNQIGKANGTEVGDTLVSTRRKFLSLAGSGLTLAFVMPALSGTLAGCAARMAEGSPAFATAFVKVSKDDIVTVVCKHLEMGQGVYSSFAMIVADEMDADWSRVRAEGAPADDSVYGNTHYRGLQGTGGSSSTHSSYDLMRKAGAAARAMLVQAASEAWQELASEITVRKGVVFHKASGRSERFGALAERAGKLAAPQDPPLKTSDRFTLMGKDDVIRLDQKDKSAGRQTYSIDMQLPGMNVAVIARPPKFGATLKTVDMVEAKAMKGVVDVFETPRGVAVIADSTWAAIRGRGVLKIEWDFSRAETRSTDDLASHFRALAKLDTGTAAFSSGEVDEAFADSDNHVIEADFSVPYLAHAPMEPLSCVGRMTENGGCEFWAGFQLHSLDHDAIARIMKMPKERITLHSLQSGGSFGRRATPDSDFASETAQLLKETGGKYPIKLMWTREDDISGGYYRPMNVHRIAVAIDKSERIVGWKQVIVGSPILKGTFLEPKQGVEVTTWRGVAPQQYTIGAGRINWVDPDVGVPVLWFRSVESNHVAFSKEVMMDRLAKALGQDPFAFRLAHVEPGSRAEGVLRLAADKAQWSRPLVSRSGFRRGRGIALHQSFGTHVAQVAEVSVAKDGGLTVDRIVCAVDCGIVVSPDGVRAQMEGGIGFGLGAALTGEISISEGQSVQTNFDSYLPLRIADFPKKIEVHLVESGEAPTGVGEPGVPPIAPAVVNAIFAATGKQVSHLPLSRNDLSWR